MSEREDQTERLPLWASERGGQQRGRIMKSPREVLIRPIALSLAAILLTSLVVAAAYSHATALHIRDPEDLAPAYLLPTIFIAVFFGSTLAVATSFVSGLAAAYLIYPPQVSIWIDDPNHFAELGFILLLAITASKAVGVIIDGNARTDAMREALGVRVGTSAAGDCMLRDLSTSRSHKPERARAVLLSALRKIRYAMTSSSQGA